jgi:hypothetical protein
MGAEMVLRKLVEELGLRIVTGAFHMDADVTRGYASDLLSDVMANAREGDVWVTLQVHQNIVGIGVLKSLHGIILVRGRQPEKETVEKAEKEGIPIMVTDLPTFEVVGRLHRLGVSGV